MPSPNGASTYVLERLQHAAGDPVDLRDIVTDEYTFPTLNDAARHLKSRLPQVRNVTGPSPDFSQRFGVFYWAPDASIIQDPIRPERVKPKSPNAKIGVQAFLLNAIKAAAGANVDTIKVGSEMGLSSKTIQNALYHLRRKYPEIRQAVGPAPKFRSIPYIYSWFESAQAPQVPADASSRPSPLTTLWGSGSEPRKVHLTGVAPYDAYVTAATNGSTNGHRSTSTLVAEAPSVAVTGAWIFQLITTDGAGRAVLRDDNGRLWMATPLDRMILPTKER